MPKRKENPYAFSERNNLSSMAIFELGNMSTLPYCLVQVREGGWVWLNRDYRVLPEGKHRLPEVREAVVHEFDTDPRTWTDVWAEVTSRGLYLWASQFDEAALLQARMQRIEMYKAGCVGRS